jgi:hypothetical protein
MYWTLLPAKPILVTGKHKDAAGNRMKIIRSTLVALPNLLGPPLSARQTVGTCLDYRE